MQAEIEILQVEKKIRSRVKKQMEKTQKEYYLNEQMQAIQKELGGGERDEFKNEIQEIEEQLKTKRMSERGEGQGRSSRSCKMMHPTSAEATVVRNYIDWILALPWYDKTEERYDLDEAEKILDEDHYGLKKIKERIVEYLAVQALTKKLKGPVLCFVGPPGVGKTSLAKSSIARSTGRKFVRLSLGGVRDEAEIRGHRRTYIGALPGKIIQSLKKAGTNNPVFLLDEIDKMSTDFRGDPAAALLEVLDPEQNHTLQRSLPRPRLRPLRRDVHHDGEHARRHPGAAPGPHGDHPAPRLHRVREAEHRGKYLVPRQKKECGLDDVRAQRSRERDPHDHPPLHEGSRRPLARARDRQHLPQGARQVVARRARTAQSRSSRSDDAAVPRRAEVPARQGRRRTTRSASPTASRVTQLGGDLLDVRGHRRARQGQARDHRPAREGHGGERAGRDELRALARRARSGSSRTSTRRSTCTCTSPRLRSARTGRARA